MTRDQALQKINLLLNLSQSQNAGEATNALNSVRILKDKFQISEEEIEELRKAPPNYSDEANLLYKVDKIIDWKARLAVIVAQKYFCYVVQEQNIANTGEESWHYYLFGEENDIKVAKALFSLLVSEIDSLILVNCVAKHFTYEGSYVLGLIDGLEERIYFGEIELPGIIQAKPLPKQESVGSGKEIVSTEKPKALPKEKPVKETQDTKSAFITDVMAWQKGIIDADKIIVSPEKLGIPELLAG